MTTYRAIGYLAKHTYMSVTYVTYVTSFGGIYTQNMFSRKGL